MASIAATLLVPLVTSSGAYAAQAPEPRAQGSSLVWNAVNTTTINVHHGDGRWIETLPGNATQWLAPNNGDYFLVGTDTSGWQNWERSATISIGVDTAPTSTTGVSGPPAPVGLRAEIYSDSAIELFWDRPRFDGTDGVTYIVRQNGVAITTSSIDAGSLFIDALTPGITHVFSVIAVTSSLVESEATTVVVNTVLNNGEATSESTAQASSNDFPSEPPTQSSSSDSSFEPPIETSGNVPTGTGEQIPVSIVTTEYNRFRVERTSKIEITWPWAGDNRQYAVYLNGEFVGDTTDHAYFFPNLDGGTEYEVAVHSFYNDGSPTIPFSVSFTTTGLPDTVGSGRPVVDQDTFGFATWDAISESKITKYPSDCLFGLSEEPFRNVFSQGDRGYEYQLCYSPSSRFLMHRHSRSFGVCASRCGDVGRRWGFNLPGDNATNNIEAIVTTSTIASTSAFASAIESEFALVADVHTSFGETAYEISRFSLNGAFIGTLPILVERLIDNDNGQAAQVNLDGADLIVGYVPEELNQPSVFSDDRRNLRVIGEYYTPRAAVNADTSTLSGWTNIGAFRAIVDSVTGGTLSTEFFPGFTATDVLSQE